MIISVVGLGKLGLCVSAVFADKGYNVIGVDSDPELVHRLKKREYAGFFEPGLKDLLEDVGNTKIHVTENLEEAVVNSEVSFIVVPTPSTIQGDFDNSCILEVLAGIREVLVKTAKKHIIVVVSTVTPGSCDKVFIPFMEETGLKNGKDFALIYNPEFIALGSVIKDFCNPDVVLIGGDDDSAIDIVVEIYINCIGGFSTICRTTSLNAEIAKLTLNCYVTAKITFANEVAAICEKVPGAEAKEILRIIGCDLRVGAECLFPGLGFGGPCFPRDNRAFLEFAERHLYYPLLSRVVIEVNNSVVRRVLKLVDEYVDGLVEKSVKIAVIGLTYKRGTVVTEESQGLEIASLLGNKGFKVWVWDENIKLLDRRSISSKINIGDTYEHCVDKADVVILALPLPQCTDIDACGKLNGLFIDCWGMFSREEVNRMCYRRLGDGPYIRQD